MTEGGAAMKRQKEVVRQFSKLRDLGDGVLPGVPLVEITGDSRVLIEHHQGVVAYGCREICVRVKYGTVSVSGSALRLARMTKEQLVICGLIDGVRLMKNGGAR